MRKMVGIVQKHKYLIRTAAGLYQGEVGPAVGLSIRRQEMALALCTDNGIMADSCGIAVATRDGID